MKELVKDLECALVALRSGTTDKKGKVNIDALSELYWETDLPLLVLAGCFNITAGRLEKKVTQKKLHYKCPQCGLPSFIALTTRKEIVPTKFKYRNYAPLCTSCFDARSFKKAEVKQKKKKESQIARNSKKQQMLHELKTMPYVDYLKTPHWEKFRKEALSWHGRTCHKCKMSGVELHIHHLTYENRGEERMEDVIVLCYDCHNTEHGGKFTKQGERVENIASTQKWKYLYFKYNSNYRS